MGGMMKFPYWSYYRLFIIPIIMLVIVAGIIVVDVLSLTNVISYQTLPSVTSVVMHCLIVILFPSVSILSISRNYIMAKEKEADAVTAQGVVQDIIKAKEIGRAVKNRLNGKLVSAKYIVIDNIKYYCFCADFIDIGDKVAIKYLPLSKYILEMVKI